MKTSFHPPSPRALLVWAIDFAPLTYISLLVAFVVTMAAVFDGADPSRLLPGGGILVLAVPALIATFASRIIRPHWRLSKWTVVISILIIVAPFAAFAVDIISFPTRARRAGREWEERQRALLHRPLVDTGEPGFAGPLNCRAESGIPIVGMTLRTGVAGRYLIRASGRDGDATFGSAGTTPESLQGRPRSRRALSRIPCGGRCSSLAHSMRESSRTKPPEYCISSQGCPSPELFRKRPRTIPFPAISSMKKATTLLTITVRRPLTIGTRGS